MSISKKIIAALALVVLVLILVLYLGSRIFLLHSFNELERASVKKSTLQVASTMQEMFKEVRSMASDWSAWDDTYQFVQDHNPAYIQSNMMNTSFVSLRMNLIMVIDKNAKMVTGKTFDLQSGKEIPIPPKILEILHPGEPLLNLATPQDSHVGLFLLPDSEMVVATRPIVTSNNEGPIQGTLLMGRFLRASYILRLAEITQTTIKLQRLDDPNPPADFARIRPTINPREPVQTLVQSGKVISGYCFLNDIYGRPALLMRVDLPRTIYQRGIDSLTYILLSLATLGLCFGLMTYILLRQTVLNRLDFLHQRVREIGASGDPNARIELSGGDELTGLSVELNRMLETLGKSQLAWRESEARYRTLFDSASDAIFIHDAEGNILEANQAACERLKYTREELQHTQIDHIEDGEFGLPFPLRIARLKERGQLFSDAIHIAKDGTQMLVELNSRLLDYGGKTAVLSVARDITERKRAEEALKYSEKKYRMLYTTMSEGMALYEILFDDNGRPLDYQVLDVNPAYEQILNRPREAAIGSKASVVDDVTPSSYIDIYAKVAFTGQPEFFDYYSTVFQKHFAISVFSPGRGRFAVLFSDITERKRTEERLRLMQFSIDHAAEAIFWIAPDGRIIYVNEAVGALLGYSLEEMLQKNVFVLNPSLSPEAWAEQWRKAKALGTISIETSLLKQDGEYVPLDITFSYQQFEGTEYCFAFAHDITERQQAELEKSALQAQLSQAQKMDAIGRLAGGIAHDFNNILTGIQGYSELLLQTMPEADGSRNEVLEIRKAADRAAGLTQQLLAFSRKQVIAPQVLNINQLITEMRKMAGRLVGEDIQFEFKLSEKLGLTKIDPHQFDQMMINLMVNARDAMPQGGKLVIETQNFWIDSSPLNKSAEIPPGAYIRLSISDSGSGIDKETIKHLFEPFFTTKAQGKGTGLGLAMVYGIVKQNDGYINVYSEAGLGTTIKIYLPRQDEEEAQARPAAPASNLPRGKETILLVEDEDMVRSLTRKLLTLHGYHVVEASQGEAAVQISRQHPESIDLLLTDVIMPQMNGKELFKILQTQRPQLKLLYMSGYSEAIIAHHGVLEDAANFIQKPFTLENLLKKVRAVLDAKV